jgi:hypothetical protein
MDIMILTFVYDLAYTYIGIVGCQMRFESL